MFQFFGFKQLLKKIKQSIDLSFLNAKWKKNNQQNYTSITYLCDINKIEVGNGTYGNLNVHDFGTKNNVFLKIGNYCSIAENVNFILAGEHPKHYVSTFPFKERLLNKEVDNDSKGNIIIHDDVWIGFGSTILSNVEIGQGSIIAAGAVVTRNVPPYSIVGGVPAKIIGYRFDQERVEQLKRIDYSKISKDNIINHLDDFYEIVNDKIIDKIINIINENEESN